CRRGARSSAVLRRLLRRPRLLSFCAPAISFGWPRFQCYPPATALRGPSARCTRPPSERAALRFPLSATAKAGRAERDHQSDHGCLRSRDGPRARGEVLAITRQLPLVEAWLAESAQFWNGLSEVEYREQASCWLARFQPLVDDRRSWRRGQRAVAW